MLEGDTSAHAEMIEAAFVSAGEFGHAIEREVWVHTEEGFAFLETRAMQAGGITSGDDLLDSLLGDTVLGGDLFARLGGVEGTDAGVTVGVDGGSTPADGSDFLQGWNPITRIVQEDVEG